MFEIAWGFVAWSGIVISEAYGWSMLIMVLPVDHIPKPINLICICGERDSHLITYQSGNAKTQIDLILLRKRNLKMAKDIKVIPSEECVPQHKLLICELRLKTPKPHPKPFSPKLRYWKLKEPTVQEEYERVFKSKVNAFNNVEASTEEIWN